MNATDYVVNYGDKLMAVYNLDQETATIEDRDQAIATYESATQEILKSFVHEFDTIKAERGIISEDARKAITKELINKFDAVCRKLRKTYGMSPLSEPQIRIAMRSAGLY